jgi:hypothetical protein
LHLLVSPWLTAHYAVVWLATAYFLGHQEGTCQLELVESQEAAALLTKASGTATAGLHAPGKPAPLWEAGQPLTCGGTLPDSAWQPCAQVACAAQGQAAAGGASIGASELAGAGAMRPLASTGVLASVLLAGGGRVVGTLGLEDELLQARLRSVSRKVGTWAGLELAWVIPGRPAVGCCINRSPTLQSCFPQVVAWLGPGSVFGGGGTIIGAGPIQAALRVVALTDVELYHVGAETLLTYGSAPLIRHAGQDASAGHLAWGASPTTARHC